MQVSIVTRPKPNKKGELPIYVRIAHAGDKAYVSTGFRVPKDKWNARRAEMRGTTEEATQLNAILADKAAAAKAAASDILASGRHCTVVRLKAAVEKALHPGAPVKEEDDPDAFAVYQRMLDRYDARGQVSTSKAYGSGLNLLKEYAGLAGSGHLFLSDLTPLFCRDFEVWLTGKKGYKANYVHKLISGLKTMSKSAAAEGVKGAEEAHAAWSSVPLRKERSRKKRLSREKVRELEALDLTGFTADVRDMFVFAFHCGGMRISDVCLLRWHNIRRDDEERWVAAWRQKKTADAVALPVLKGARRVLDRWISRTGQGDPDAFVFGQLTDEDTRTPQRLRAAIGRRTSLINKYLKERLAPMIDVEPFTTHVARHSVATHLAKSGAGNLAIKGYLGHRNMRMLDTYLAELREDELWDELGNVLD